MRPDELDDLITGYFRDWERMLSPSRAERMAEPDDRLSDWLIAALFRDGDAPEEVWPIIVALVDRAPNDEALGFVAAGPLEDLIRRHGQQFEDRLVERARRDRRFRQALRGVWGWEKVPERLRRRIQELLRSPDRGSKRG